MKTAIVALGAAVILAAALIYHTPRYQLVVNLPTIIRLDRLTGQTCVEVENKWVPIEEAKGK